MTTHGMPSSISYAIRVEGHLDITWVDWFDGLTLTHEPNGNTLLSGRVRDQAALYGLLNRLGTLGLPLVAVHRESDDEQCGRG
jgi:hypothetical protein